MNLQAIREALSERLTQVTGVRPLSHPTGQIPTGQATVVVIQPGDTWIDYQGANAKGLAFVEFIVSPWVPIIDLRSAFAEIDALMSSGTVEGRSLPDCLDQADRTFGGVCDYIVIQSASGARAVGLDTGPRFLTADLTVRVFVGRR